MQSDIVIQNPEASMPLRIRADVTCNTPDETILSNVLTNSRRIKDWVKIEPEHDRVAIVCGGGPSLADTLNEIRYVEGDIFALNGAAKFLKSNGIDADWQILMDAQPATADLIGPAGAYLFASQVDPKCFDLVPSAKLWHSTYGNLRVDEQDGFPEHGEDYCLIGSSISVGNTSLVLLYVLGYRIIHVFGMDSSHRNGDSHAYRQPMNDGEPCTLVEFGGKEYTCSLTMELQARNFRLRAQQLKAAGCEIIVHGDGLLPAMANAKDISEVEKYEMMWEHDAYRGVSPGELSVDIFLEVARPDGKIIDFGCGTGRGSLKLRQRGHNVVMVDFAKNCLDPEVSHIPFVQADLTKPIDVSGSYGYCTDVMEHIPPEDVETVITNIMNAAPVTYFQISTVPDNMGSLIGRPLHLTVRDHRWWRYLFYKLGYFVKWQQEDEINSSFLVERSINKKENAA